MDDLQANFFNVYLCHVCKTKESFSQSNLCSGCKLVSYCSKEHQKADWGSHKSICKVAQNLIHDAGEDDLFTVGLMAVAFSFYKELNGMKNLQRHPLRPGHTRTEVKSRLVAMIGIQRGRDLDRVEMKMIFFAHHCAVCFMRGTIKKELVCTKCFGVDYCSAEHRDSDDHDKVCADFQKVLDMDLFMLKLRPGFLEAPFIIKTNQAVKLKLDAYDMKSFIAKYVRPGLKFEAEALSSIFLTCVLTFAHTINRFPNFSLSKKLIVHIVGAHALCEGRILEHWENLLHFFPQVQALTVLHISPCIDGLPMESSLCASCYRANKSINFLYYNQLYHEYQDSSNFLKPDVIVAYNSGLFEALLDYDPWKLSLPLFFKYDNVPVILTEGLKREAESDLERLRPYAEASGKKVRYVAKCERNAFHNLRPWRDSDGTGYEIRRKNSYVTAFIVERY